MYVVDKPLKLREVMTKMSVSVPTVFQISYRSIKEHKIKSFGNIKQPVQKKKKMPWCHHASPSTTQILFPCLQFDVHVQWFTLAVDSCDARCLLQPAINCLVWHWVSMILSAHWYMVRYIKHTRMHKLRCMQTHTRTTHTDRAYMGC